MARYFSQPGGDAVERGRQLAIGQHSTVYMVFVPDASTLGPNAPAFANKQFTSYAYVTLRTPSDQPGRPTLHYLSSWKTLPEGSFICSQKFQPFNPQVPALTILTNGSQG